MLSIYSGDSIFVGDNERPSYDMSISFDEVRIVKNDMEEVYQGYPSECPVPACPPGSDCIQSCSPPSPLNPNVLEIAFENNLLFYTNNYDAGGAHYEAYLIPKTIENNQAKPQKPQSEDPYIPVELYIIANHRQDITSQNFYTAYAGWIRKNAIEKLGVDTNGNPLIAPTQKKYFLTKLTSSIQQKNMTEDIFSQQAFDDKLINARELPLVEGKGAVIWFIVGAVFMSTVLLAMLLWWTFGKREAELPPGQG
jgi:hypothetical protein